MSAKPILKWAGGKRQLINKIKELMPEKYNSYFEPFVGGGALFFDLLPSKALINDVNSELTDLYKCLSDENLYKLMIKEIDKHVSNHSEKYYYEIRALDREPGFANQPIWVRASRTVYLNKSCFNGLYRVNSHGYFNVPSGKKEKINAYNKENTAILHKYFMKEDILILNDDFVYAVKNAGKGDFVYFDPPYDPFEDKNSFTSYTKGDFTKEDQKRLAQLFTELNRRGVYVMLSNHNTRFINELYRGFNIHIVNAKRMINSNAKGRGNVEEVIITNY